MKRFLLVLFIIFILCGLLFSNEKSVNSISFSLISNYHSISMNWKTGITNFAAAVGMEPGDMMKLGINLTSTAISSFSTAILSVILAYVFVWLLWNESYPQRGFVHNEAWTLSFSGPYVNKDASSYAFGANFFLICTIVFGSIGVLLVIPGIILWAVGSYMASTTSTIKKEQKIVPVVTGDKIGVIIKL